MRTSQEQHETERFRDFDRQLRKPLLRSHPSQLARTEGKPSTKYPKTYLVASRRQQCQLQQQLRRDSARTALPESLQALLQRQRSNGKWDPCDEITQLTNCCRLQPPEGYSYDWRWATALACVVLKRHPQYFEQLQEAYDRAVQWLEGHQLPLAEAHRRLPPTDSELYYTIPTGAIEKGNWREWTQLLLDTSGYTGFTAKEDAIDGMPEPRRKRLPGIVIDPAAADREQLQGLKLELLDAKCKVQHSFHKGERVECRWRRRDRLCRPQLERSWHTAVVTRTYEDGSADVTFDELRWEGEAERRVANCHLRKCCDSRGVGAAGSRGSSSAAASRSSHGDARGAAVAASKRQPQQHTTLGAETQEVFSSAASVLRHSWSAPLTLQQELARLQHVRQRRARPRPEFQVRSAAAAASAAGRQRSQRCHSPERKSRRAKADPPPPTTLLQLSACGTQQDSGGGGGGGGDDGGAALAEAEGRAVSAILAYESCLSAVRECLAETLAAASAPPPQSYTAQAARFERLRAMLGAGHTAQPGHSDWRQRDAPGLLLATVAAVEARRFRALARRFINTFGHKMYDPCLSTISSLNDIFVRYRALCLHHVW
ncbi:hypothetical protein JKP88DRAFT_311346 [Tribonema minus]|uniref:Uncharacterized protein n=1 Tax=Tribonema minus TaxID=303371 RepID=A0A836CGG0_9STRA|nr:hypothetical protein JKP88DRAFT_311346 [Tribonema minus]